MNIINHFVNIYYITIIAYSLDFLALSLYSLGTPELPWAKCNPIWSSPSKLNILTNVSNLNKSIQNFKIVLIILTKVFTAIIHAMNPFI